MEKSEGPECGDLSQECLLDGFLALYDECTHDNLLKVKHVSAFVKKYNKAVHSMKSKRMKLTDFEMKAVIGRGHFGEVRVVSEKSTEEVYAMRVLRKAELLSQPEISFYEEERDIMANARSSWITQLHYAFQDSVNLYLVMDFHAGGDLLSLLRRHDDIFHEDMGKFYIAEMALAINSLHEMGYIHRDIKPENVLLDFNGHVKLADFGSAAKLDESGKVSAKVPVGTPDYVAPELLLAMNKCHSHFAYGTEIDWWSLGICAYEILFGATPFTTSEASKVSTYANIMSHKKTLRFPEEGKVSAEAKDFISKLLATASDRMYWPDIKQHSFFKGINWDTIREGEAFYVPSINGLDDTSHFDEVEKVKHQPDIEALRPQKDFSGRDLPFVGFTFFKALPQGVINSPQRNHNNNHAADNGSCMCNKTSSRSSTDNPTFQRLLAEKDEDIQHLRYLLEQKRLSWSESDKQSVTMFHNLTAMNSEIRSFEDKLMEVKLEEMKGDVVLLEAELTKLTSQLKSKEQQLEKANAALEETTQQLKLQQKKLDKEKRRSRDNRREDLKILDLHDEKWENLLEDKQACINELTARIKELEALVEAYEDSEERQATEVQQLEHKLNTSLHTSLPDLSLSSLNTDVLVSANTGDTQVELGNFHHRFCPSGKKLTLHVTVKAGRCSFLDNNTLVKLQELQKIVDKYTVRAREWQQKEEELNAKIAGLETEVSAIKQREGMGRKMKDSLMDNVASYQQEVQTQRAVIKDLQETMRTYLRRSIALSDTEKNFKDLQQRKLELETELLALKDEAEQTRQANLAITSEMKEVAKKLEEQRVLAQNYKKRLDDQVETTEKKMSSLEEELTKVKSDRQRLERREAALTTQVETLESLLDDRNVEIEKLEKRIADIQIHLQQLQQRNTDLQVQVESLQKESSDKDQQKQSVTDLSVKISRLEQQNTDLERRITAVLREKQNLDDKMVVSEREKERLLRKIKRLEAADQEKRELESKLEKMSAVERENRRLELKLERMTNLEKEKLNLEERLDKLQMDLRKEKINYDSLLADKKFVESKLSQEQNNKVTEVNEVIAQLKIKLSLMETTNKEKDLKISRLEKQVLDSEKLLTEKEKDLQQSEKNKAECENKKTVLEKEKKEAENKLQDLVKEKVVLDEHMAKLNLEIDRLESKCGILKELKSNPEVSKLSAEINRLKKIVDKLEQDKVQDSAHKRNSSEGKSGLIDKLQREKADLQKQVEQLEKETSRNPTGQPSKTSMVLLRQESNTRQQKQLNEEKITKLEQELANMKMKLQKAETHTEVQSQNKVRSDELEKCNKDIQEKLSGLKTELAGKQKEIEDLKSQLSVQTTNVVELRAEIEELLKTENDLLLQLEKEAMNAQKAREENEKMAAQLQEKSFKTSDSSTLTTQLAELKKQLEDNRKEMEIRKGASELYGGDIPAFLRHELEESNLALSEARSLLAASKRQELELRDRIDRLQKTLDNQAVENARYLQNSQDAVAELRTWKSQCDTLKRQYQVLEDKYNSLQKDHGSSSHETVHLSEEISRKHQQFEMEQKKVEQLNKMCCELEEQRKELEATIARFKQREIEWESIKKSYEKAVGERENQLEGANKHLKAISSARSEESEKILSMKQQLDSIKALHKADVEKLNNSLREEMLQVKKLSSKVAELEQLQDSSSEVVECQKREINKASKEVMKLKEELTQSLSDNSSLRKENGKLKQHLQEAMDKFELIVGEKVNLENFAETLQGLHWLDKYKFESTIGQQMKLIDYLQDLNSEHSGKKKKSKLFGVKGGKDGSQRMSSAPLSLTDLQMALDQERSKCRQLEGHVDKLKTENMKQASECGIVHKIKKVLKIKSSSQESINSAGKIDRVQANLTLKVTHPTQSPGPQRRGMGAASSSLSLASSSSSSSGSSQVSAQWSTPSSRSLRSYKGHLSEGTQSSWMSEPTPQRMHHNIPHRFATGLNTRATKCGLCLGTVHFVRQASKCHECGLVVHPKCAASVPATCGLPTEYVRHFALMMSQIYKDSTQRESDLDRSAVRMEGWLKVPRVGKTGWENRYCILEGTWLSLYLNDNDGNPVDSFDLSPMDAEVSVHSAVTSAELTNTASTDLHYILRLDQDPLTTCWPGRYLYLMTTNFQEKQRWVASLEAVVKSVQCKNELYRNKSQMLTVLSLKEAEQREFNCSLVISPQLVLLGTDDGLYAVNPEALTSKHSRMTQLTGFGSVYQMGLARGVDLIIILTGPERRLVMLENKLVKCRMSQTLGGETTPFSFRMVEGLQSCTVFDLGLWNNASYLCVGTPTKLYLLKYNPSLAMYCVRKEFPSCEPCSCICIAENYAIVGTERFYKINLEHPSLLDFVDRQDSSLAFAAYGAANHNSYPLAVVRTSPENLPLEFLLCFHEFGVFVDHRGQRSRATDIKWSGLPLAFAYVEPFLYVTYTNTIQATEVPTDRAVAKGRQTVFDIQCARYLGPAPLPGSVYVSSSDTSTNITEIICLRGQEEFSTDYSNDKENSQGSKQVHFASPRKHKIHHLPHGSLTSLNSNSSESTLSSMESGV